MTGTGSPKRHVLSRRARIAVRVGVTGLVLGLLVLGVGAFLGMQRPVPSPAPAGAALAASPGQGDYTAGMAALASGDTTKGAALLAASAAAGNTAAKAKVAEIAKRPELTSAGTTTGPTVPDAYSKPVSDMGTLLPASVTGYTVGIVETTTVSAIMPLQATGDGPLGKASVVVLSVFDKHTVAGARSYVVDLKRAYPKDLRTVVIGSSSGRFGTDGSHLASAAFSRGRYAFEVVVTATRGAPRDLRSVTLRAAEAFAAARTAP